MTQVSSRPRIFHLQPGPEEAPSRVVNESLQEAAQVLLKGGLVAYPTETFYGLGASVSRPDALEEVFRIKGRDRSKPLMVCGDSIARLEGLIQHISPEARLLMDRFWPGPLTLLLPSRPGIHPSLTGELGKIGVRVPGNRLARELVAMVGNPITATSANPSGTPGLTRWEDVARELGEDLELILAWPEPLPGMGSTIIDLCYHPVLVREGIIPVKEIQEVLARPLTRGTPPL